MARIVDYFEKYKNWDFQDAFEFLDSEKLRLGEDVRFKPGGIEEMRFAEYGLYSYSYAADFLKDRFVLGEPAIAGSARYSFRYAGGVIKGRFELGEPAIAGSANYSYHYAADLLGGRFELGEPAIAESTDYSFGYVRDVIKGRFELGEPAIAKRADYSYEYAKDFLKGRFELGEPVIAESDNWSYAYAKDVLKGRFPAGEKALMAEFFRDLGRSRWSFDGYLQLLKSTNDPYYYILANLKLNLWSLKHALMGDKELVNLIHGVL